MSELRLEPLLFIGAYPLIQPYERKLFDLAVEFVKANFAEPLPNLQHMDRVLVAVEYQVGAPIAVHGIIATQLRPDIPVMRTAGPNAKKAFALLFDGMRQHLLEKGYKGAEILVEYGEDAEPGLLCPNLEESLKAVEAHSPKRKAVTLK